MQALSDLFKSVRGLFALLLVAAATVLCAVGKLSVSDWREMALYVFGIYVGGKTISGTAAAIVGGKRDAAALVTPTAPDASPAPPAPAAPAPAAPEPVVAPAPAA
jgi:hypothetical protein